ncbi:MAG: diaminopimelate epimerase [Bryobacterales bacterium]|nr:diaminopimelate epimerase [Bryobacterales bacterium]
MRISFTKAHGAGNDFLLTWTSEAPREGLDRAARAICGRHTGIGADGWMLVSAAAEERGCHAEIRLYNSDGSRAEISGNGTRCAAAFLVERNLALTPVRIRTEAGLKELRLIERSGLRFSFEMDMGRPVSRPEEARCLLDLGAGRREVTLLNAGNPQCAVFVDDFTLDWRSLGAEIESHPRFPSRTNVSFVRVEDEHTLDVRFWERGAGETMSSGTGSCGAVWAAMLRGLVRSPVRVLTPGGPMDARWDETLYLTGPAEITGRGEYYFE